MSKISRFAGLMGLSAKKKADEPKDKEQECAEKPTRKDGESDEDYEKRVKEWEDEQDEGESAENPKDTTDDTPQDSEKEKKSKAQGYAEGFSAANARWADVLASNEAQGRVVVACNLLADTEMSAAQIQKTLATLPVEKARATLAERTGGQGTPAPATDGGRTGAVSKGQQIIAARDRVLGKQTA